MSSHEYGRRGRRPPAITAHAEAQATRAVPPSVSDEDSPTVALPAVGPSSIVVARAEKVNHEDPRLTLLVRPDSEQAAAYRVLRHRLDERSCRAVCVAGAGHGEGATTLAINLALALGECGRARVALLEINLRSPGLAAMLGVVPSACFSEQLAAHRARPADPWFVIEVFTPCLHVGLVRPERAGAPLLDTAPFSTVTEQFRRGGYDYVVYDCAPILRNADVVLAQEGADGVLIATTSGVTRARELRQAARQIDENKLVGVVVIAPGPTRARATDGS